MVLLRPAPDGASTSSASGRCGQSARHTRPTARCHIWPSTERPIPICGYTGPVRLIGRSLLRSRVRGGNPEGLRVRSPLARSPVCRPKARQHALQDLPGFVVADHVCCQSLPGLTVAHCHRVAGGMRPASPPGYPQPGFPVIGGAGARNIRLPGPPPRTKAAAADGKITATLMTTHGLRITRRMALTPTPFG